VYLIVLLLKPAYDSEVNLGWDQFHSRAKDFYINVTLVLMAARYNNPIVLDPLLRF
jgi:hypothetical protein